MNKKIDDDNLCSDCRKTEHLIRDPDGKDRCLECSLIWEKEKFPEWVKQ